MRKPRFDPISILSGMFIFGSLLGSAAGIGLARSCSVYIRDGLWKSSLAQSSFYAMLPILPVLFAGTSTLGLLMIPILSLLRGFAFSFTASLLFPYCGILRTAAEFALPGAFFLAAFFIVCENAEKELTENIRLPVSGKWRRSLPIFILLFIGAALRLFSHTLF